MKVTAVIPTYNGALWLPKSIPKVDNALANAGIDAAEILVINDGSVDNTLDVIKNIKTKYPIRVVSRPNEGRFVARKIGTLEAKYDLLLFVDTRVFIGKKSLKYVLDHYDNKHDKVVWNSHVRVDKTGNPYARFWDAIAFVAWRSYFKNPRDISYGIRDFDKYPKGTTCFFIPKKIMKAANEWFEENTYTKDLKKSNDDTLLIRYIARHNNINLSPDFWCIYNARPNFRQFIKHVYHRGQVFVDGFLRNDGNIFFVPLVLFLIASLTLPLIVLVAPQTAIYILYILLSLWAIEFVTLLGIGVGYKDALSMFYLSPVFSLFYSAGIWRATTRILVANISKEKDDE